MLPILRELKEWALRILKGKAAPRSLWLLFPIAGILAVVFHALALRGSGAGGGEAGGRR
mgnify:CR=1 FL=1